MDLIPGADTMATKKKTTKKKNASTMPDFTNVTFTNVLIEVPMVICCDGYREFHAIQEILKKFNRELRCEEVDLQYLENEDFILGSEHWGLIYHGKRPSKKTVKKLVEDAILI